MRPITFSNNLNRHVRYATMLCSARQLLLLTVGCLAALAIDRSALAAPEDTIAQRAKPCMSCHGEEGRAAPDGYYPRIAGKPAGYLLHQLQAFRDGTRANAAMAYLLHGMPDRYLQEFAEYFANQHPPYETRAPASFHADASRRRKNIGDAG